MRKELEEIQKIEAFLMGRMDEGEMKEIDEKMESDAQLARQVQFQSLLMKRIKVHGLKKEIQAAHDRFHGGGKPSLWKWGKSVGIVLLLGILGYFAQRGFDRGSSFDKKETTGLIKPGHSDLNLNIPLDSLSGVGHPTSPISTDSTVVEKKKNEKKKTKKKSELKNQEPIVIDMVQVKGGEFQLNKNFSIEIESFELGKYEVTQDQWQSVMGSNPSHFKGCQQCPVENVSWNEIQVFIKKLNKGNKSKYRLPTHPEWSYAARGGNKRKGLKYYKNRENLEEMAWCIENAEEKTHPVGTRKPSELGVYDMQGNVWEWVADVWPDDYDETIRSTHNRAKDRSDKMLLGGAFTVSPKDFYLIWYLPEFTDPNVKSPNLGFRLARDIEQDN